MEIANRTFDRLWRATEGGASASDSKLEEKILAWDDLWDSVGCDSVKYLDLTELPSATFASEQLEEWVMELAPAKRRKWKPGMEVPNALIAKFLREEIDGLWESDSMDACESPAVGFLSLYRKDGEDELVAAITMKGYASMGVDFELFGIFRTDQDADRARVPAVERLCEKFLHVPPATPIFRPEQRSDLFTHVVEPTLQQELKHKGAANGDGSYAAKLIGYDVEIC